MRRATLVLAALVLTACPRGTPANDHAQGAGGSGTTAAPGAPAATAPSAAATAPSPTPPSDPSTLTFIEGSPERKVQLFCIANYKKLGTCFDDQSFWEILATIFFAKNPSMDDGQPRTRSMWIGMRKDDFAGLMREKRVPADCEASIRHSRWPSTATMERVDKARAATCPAFANAFGTMLFVEGAFSEPR